ncbi:apolipoprotein A-II [Rousettus aegyptiacus]|uniref:apolipoprotein A-II n=1 Tax=Rousettus aegyptiacus TaxID=9407 RepID=UPI00168D3987|nr:apolipoprotein A-II [Rousettus aegyptiacus]
MKLLAVTVLVLTICSLEGGYQLRRQECVHVQALLSQHFQTAADYGKDLVDTAKGSELQAHTDQALEYGDWSLTSRHHLGPSYWEKTQEQPTPLVWKAGEDLVHFTDLEAPAPAAQ